MNLERLLADESYRQQEFPVCERTAFLAHAGVSPLPRCVAEAMERYLEAATRANQEDVLPERTVSETRQLAANLIGAHPDEIAFTGSTSMGLAMVAAGLAWQPGDNVVCYRDDYPANVYPWMDLARWGVEVQFVQPAQYGRVTLKDVAQVVDKRTRLVSLASVHFVTGWRLDVDAIGKMLREGGVLFCLDAIQSIGALPTSVRQVDFAAADAHKWLLGPLGAAILYVRRECFDRLHPSLIGWSSGPCPGFVAQDHLQLWPSARRYEPGSLNLAGIVGLHEALRMLTDIGIETIERRVWTLARRLVTQCQEAGWRLAGPVEDGDLSGIISVWSPDHDVVAWQARVSQAGVVTSLRQNRDGQTYLRASPHFYNTDGEVNRLLENL